MAATYNLLYLARQIGSRANDFVKAFNSHVVIDKNEHLFCFVIETILTDLPTQYENLVYADLNFILAQYNISLVKDDDTYVFINNGIVNNSNNDSMVISVSSELFTSTFANNVLENYKNLITLKLK